MILGILFFISQIIFGVLIFDFFDPEKKFHPLERITGSILLGVLFSGFLVLIFSLIFKSLTLSIFFFSLIFFLILGLRFKKLIYFFSQLISFLKQRGWISLKNFWIFCLLGILIIYSLYISTILFRGLEGEIKSTLPGWGDNAFHLNLIERFTTVSPFDLKHPLFAGSNLTYPFIIDFISSIFRKLGADQIFSYRLPLLTFGLIGIILIFSFAYHILKSKALAVLSLIFILFGSGLGFLVLFKDSNLAYQNEGFVGIFNLIKNPPHEYTHLDNRTGGKPSEKETENNIVWIVPVISFLSHQRSFSLGLAIFLLILLGIYYYGMGNNFWRFGIIAGFLPFSHSHSFLALFFLLGTLFWFFLKNCKNWVKFAATTLILALPQVIYFNQSSTILEGNFFKPWFGWMTCNHVNSWFFCDPLPGTDSNLFIFWSKNFGIVFFGWLFVLLSSVFSFYLPSLKNKIKDKFDFRFIAPSFILFILPNLFLFQPWDFDNGKIFFYWWLLAIIFCFVPILKILWEKNFFGKTSVIFLVFFGILAGGFDFSSKFLSYKKNSFGYSDGLKDNITMAQWIKKNIPNNALFLTSPSIDPIPLFLAGRPVYLSYEGWLWSQGLNYLENKENAEEILKGNLKKACQEKIDYIFLDSGLKQSYPQTNEEVLLTQTEIVFSFEERKILQINCQNK